MIRAVFRTLAGLLAVLIVWVVVAEGRPDAWLMVLPLGLVVAPFTVYAVGGPGLLVRFNDAVFGGLSPTPSDPKSPR